MENKTINTSPRNTTKTLFSKREIIKLFPDQWSSGVKEPRSQRKGRTEK